MKKHTRRWWLIIVIVVVAAAAAAAAAYLLVFRDKPAGVHYLTSTAATGTVSKTVQADFTLTNANGAMTISLSGTGSSSSASNGDGSASTTSASSVRGAITTVSAVVADPIVFDRTVIADGAASPTPTPTPTSAPTITALIPASGPVRSSVTLIGSGFTGAETVTFNGRKTTFIVNSDTQVTATVPTGASSGPVAVSNADGTGISAGSFTVIATPKPKPSPSRTGNPSSTSTRSASSSSYAGRSGTSLTASNSSSSASSSSAGSSSGTSGVVTNIAVAAGGTPYTLQRLLSVSGKPVYAFVSSTPLYTTLSTSLSSGSQSTNVAALQRALKARGYFTGTVNGDFGTTTQTALEAWQSAQGLSQTGEITTSDFVWLPGGAAIESWNVGLGGSVSSSTALATIDFPRKLVAEALVTQADISSLKVGQKAALTIDGETSDPFTGIITSISSQPASSSSSGSSSSTAEYTVNVAPKSLPSLARSGMTGSLTVTIASRSNVLLVPTSAVSGTSSASFVRVMMNGTPSYREVTTGMATSSLTQITSGLTAGEVVITGTYSNAASSSSSTNTGLGGLGGLGGGSFRRSSGSGGIVFNGGSGGGGQ